MVGKRNQIPSEQFFHKQLKPGLKWFRPVAKPVMKRVRDSADGGVAIARTIHDRTELIKIESDI
jgi:hypothetical protein